MRSEPPEARLYRLIFEHTTDATAVVDDDGRVLLMNRAARTMPGVNVEQLFRWTADRDHALVSFRAQLRVGGRASGELCVKGDEGPRWLALEGRAQGPVYVVTVRDVTARREQDAELRHLRRLEALGYLTAGVVHDFNNVLTAVVCSASVLARALPADDPASALARNVVTASERGAGLVRRLLRGLRREPAKPERVNLSTAVAESKSLIDLVVGRSVDVQVDLSPSLDDVSVDREQLDQVLLNLAANARDAMPRGGVLRIATANVSGAEAGEGGCKPDGAYVALVVTDSGRGMSREERERVFERFFTTKDAGEGTGLGLATAHRFVKASSGCIAVRSAPGQGTSVVVYLPRLEPMGRVIPLVQPAAEAPGGRETILVIEPDDNVRFVIRAALSERGYRVLDAPTGELALRQAGLAELEIDLVLADLGCPGLRGDAVARTLRAAGHPARLLYASGMTDRELAELDLGDVDVLRKAFTPAQLARRVRAVLETHTPAQSGEVRYDAEELLPAGRWRTH